MHREGSGPIGIFDSGVGGLTVLRALMSCLPDESTVYLGDTARVPYGSKSPDVVTRYSLHNARFLAAKGIKMLVVACNTASAVALPALEAQLKLPVLGVIEPGASAAAAQTRNRKVGVIGTHGTIRSGAYARALAARLESVEVVSRACPLFVPLAEEGWVTGEVPRLVAERYLGDLAQTGLDTLVLGCTHYPLLKQTLGEVLGGGVALVDSAQATAEAAARLLDERSLRAAPGAPVSRAFFVTDTAERFAEVGERFLGQPIARAEQVDLHLTG